MVGEDPEPSLHEIREKASTEAWDSIRTALRDVAVECNSMPSGQKCILCSTLAEYRCIECAAWAFYCPECCGNAHQSVGIFHTGEIWQVRDYGLSPVCHLIFLKDGMYKPVVIQRRTIDVRQPHDCDSSTTVTLCCIDSNGMYKICTASVVCSFPS